MERNEKISIFIILIELKTFLLNFLVIFHSFYCVANCSVPRIKNVREITIFQFNRDEKNCENGFQLDLNLVAK